MPRRPLAAVPDQPKRVVLYVRVSSLMGRGGDDFHSPDIQTNAMRRLTAGMVEVGVVDDIDVSGRSFAREGLDKVRAMAEARQIDAVAVYNVSRLGRNVRESLTFLNWLADRGVRVISASEQVDTDTPTGRLMLTNMLAIAEYRSDEIGQNWSSIIDTRARAGKHHGKPIGYMKVGKKMVPHPVDGPAVTEAFRRYGADEPIGEVTAAFATARGKPMMTQNLKKLFRNPVYRGFVTVGGETLPGDHDELVDEETWDKVQNRLAADAGAAPRHLSPGWSLVGLVYCPHGHHLQRNTHHQRRTNDDPLAGQKLRVDRLVCGMGRSQAKGGCEGVGAPLLDRVEAEVLRQVSEYVERLRADTAGMAARKAAMAAGRADRAALEREVSRVRTAMSRATTRWALGDIPDAVYQSTMTELREAESTAAVELARATPAGDPVEPEQLGKLVDSLLAAWPDLTPAERGRTLRSVISKVVVRGAATWREPEEDRVTVHFRW